ncbi:hypothetical protein [Maribacter polysaccharolyticus]|uniref:hypothetical protein n=1 Tax=Maribacter polysaccharolyticus TaxID=3020831 RepID=UPI00237F43AA|nr:hypothetical protein [Maribacter polysaccharolyticus]MDE3742539.1 hypothetical protein [Maribacter polysaccharolyticus]
MTKYYVDQTAQPNGDHVVHKEGCHLLALAKYTKGLGLHVDCHSALVKAMDYYPNTANGCKSCAMQCHCPKNE